MSEPRGGEIETGLAIGECTDDAGPPPDLPHDAFERIVGADLVPMNVGEGIVGQRLVDAAFNKIGRCVHPGGAQIVSDRPGLPIGCLEALLGMGRKIARNTDPLRGDFASNFDPS